MIQPSWPDIMEKLEEMSGASLLKRHVTPEAILRMSSRKSDYGASLYECIKPGLMLPDSHVGVVAPDPSAYTTFKELFDPIIRAYHHESVGTKKHHTLNDFGNPTQLPEIPERYHKLVKSTRMRVARSIVGYPFTPIIDKTQRAEIEVKCQEALKGLEGDLAGTYHSLNRIPAEEMAWMIEENFLFNNDDKFYEKAGVYRDWPSGRGIFYNDAKTFLVWVNEEDHLKIISMEEGWNVSSVYDRLIRASTEIERRIRFAYQDGYGYLNTCPVNLGTAFRTSMYLALPYLAERPKTLKEYCVDYYLELRGTIDEKLEEVLSPGGSGVFDVSNFHRVGLTEFQCVQEMLKGVTLLLKKETELMLNS